MLDGVKLGWLECSGTEPLHYFTLGGNALGDLVAAVRLTNDNVYRVLRHSVEITVRAHVHHALLALHRQPAVDIP